MNTRCAGFSFFELVVTVALTATLFLAFGLSHYQMISQASYSLEQSDSRQDVHKVIEEIELAIQRSETIDKSGSGVLALTTRYLIDEDDDTESVVYVLSSNQLTKQIDAGAVETLLVGVQSFASTYLEIKDEFLASNYDAVLPEGNNRSVDPETKARYEVWELGQVDPDLVDAFEPTEEHLDVLCSPGYKLVEVAPPLPAKNLSAEITWVPMVANKRYWPLAYGSANKGVALTFNSGTAYVSRYTFSSDVGPKPTIAHELRLGKEYDIGFRILDGEISFWMDQGTGRVTVGKVSLADLDNLPIYCGGLRNSRATYDNLRVWNPLVEFSLTVDLSGQGTGPTESFVGKATPRQ
ncbi:MAG: hypothetical protein AAF581_06750 [Planctomycetota bacterium]